MKDYLERLESFLARNEQSGTGKGPRPRLDMGLLEVDLALAGFTVLLAHAWETLPSDPFLTLIGRLTIALSLTSGGIHILWWFLGPSAQRFEASVQKRLRDSPLGRIDATLDKLIRCLVGHPYEFVDRLAYFLLALGWLTFVGGLMGRG